MNVLLALKQSGELTARQSFLVHGDPTAKIVLIFEKPWVFKHATELFDDQFLICTAGVPSKSCLDFIKKLGRKKFLYFGDLDPISIYIYLTLIYCKRKFSLRDKPKLTVKFCGLRFADFKKYLTKKALIKLDQNELAVLDFLKQFKLPNLKRELKFLEGGFKVEMEALKNQIDKYLKIKFNNL